MVSLNKVFLVGNLTRDPELRYTPGGTPVATLGLAVNRTYKSKDGQNQQDTCFLNVVVWSQMAEVSNQYLQKGSPVLIEGRLQSRSWENSEKQRRTTIEVVASRVQFLPQRRSRDQEEPKGKDTEKVVNLDDEDNNLGEAI
ncbi:MAG: single-stranded DNA-binding protein [Candidatus Omnitrophica bacterium]|nr:single-stranded DNA-binding protein [Candidatus Omnitrophota bacterium]MCF7893463.1 single-stranded DNA-binding protein [Candidatus Omnitrophota bacterium]